MTPCARQIFWNIINCHNISSCSCSSTSSNPCKTIIGYQRQFACHWHVPEPWNGDIENAPILFILSNPSYSDTEVYPEVPTNIPSRKTSCLGRKWTAQQIEDFFENRFNGSIQMPPRMGVLQYVQGLKTLQNSGSYSNRQVNTWVGLCKYATAILHGSDMVNNGLTTLLKTQGAKIKINPNNIYQAYNQYMINPGVDFAITEVVKCKSKSEIGVNAAVSECSNKYLGAVLSLFKGHTICVCGKVARDAFNNHLKKSGLQQILQPTNGIQNVNVIFLPHPSSRVKNILINGVRVL